MRWLKSSYSRDFRGVTNGLQGWRMSMNKLKFQAQFWMCNSLGKVPLDLINISTESVKRKFRDHLIHSLLSKTGKISESPQEKPYSIFIGNLWNKFYRKIANFIRNLWNKVTNIKFKTPSNVLQSPCYIVISNKTLRELKSAL